MERDLYWCLIHTNFYILKCDCFNIDHISSVSCALYLDNIFSYSVTGAVFSDFVLFI